MAAAVQASWSVRNFFPPRPLDIPESPVPAAIAHRLWGDDYETSGSSVPSLVGVPDAHLDAQNAEHTLLAAQQLVHGGIVLASMNGHVMCLADADRPQLLPVMARLTGRPQEEAALFCAPEWLSEHVDMDALSKHYRYANIMKFNQEFTCLKPFLLGLQLPANAESSAPQHLVHDGALVSMWTEHPSIRDMFTHVRYFGGRALMAISFGSTELHEALKRHRQSDDVSVTLFDDSLPRFPQSKVTLLDFTHDHPLLISQGTDSLEEISDHLLRWNLGSCW